MAIPAGPPKRYENNSLEKRETKGFPNEINGGELPSVSLFPRTDPPIAEMKTAAQVGPLNGSKKEKESVGTFRNENYHDADVPSRGAAIWFAENRGKFDGRVIPTLRGKFGLSTKQAIRAIQMANEVAR